MVDRDTGEVLDFATVRPGAQFWSGKLTDDAKQQAVDAVIERIDAVTGLLAVAA